MNSMSSGFNLRWEEEEEEVRSERIRVKRSEGGKKEGAMRKRGEGHSPVAERVDEVEATVDAMVFNVPSVEARLVSQVLVILLIAVVDDRLPAREREARREREKEEGGKSF